MQSSYELTGRLSSNRKSIILDHPETYVRVFEPWKDKDLHVKVSLFEGKRTLQQNRYFHGVIVQIIRDFLQETQGEQYTIEQTKMFIYHELLDYDLIETTIAGKTYYSMEGKRCHEWGIKEFSEKKEKIQKFMAEMGVLIPDPDSKYDKL